jgi:HPr kinase/phosphorylase
VTSAPDAVSVTLHANCVLLGEDGVLIEGPSGSGKSWLTARLVADWTRGAARLISDDRTTITRHGQALVARPHPIVAGHLEWRTLGIMPMPSLEAARLVAVIRLGAKPSRLPSVDESKAELLTMTLPCLRAADARSAYDTLLAMGAFWLRHSGAFHNHSKSILEKTAAVRDKDRLKATASSPGPP